MNTLLRNARRRRENGEVISIWLLILILIAGVAVLVYMLFHLIRIPPRQLPNEAAPQYYQYIYDVIPDFAERPVSERERPWAPTGMVAKKPSVLTSTNLIDWESVQLEPYADGALVAPDGAELTLDAIWDEATEQSSYQLLLLKPGTTPYRFYKLPQ